MRVEGCVLPLMAHDDDVAVAAFGTRVVYEAIADAAHARADRGGVVDPLVRAPVFVDRMAGRAESGADPREFERRAQERLAQVLPVGRVVAAVEIHRAEGLRLVGELSGE